MHRPLLLRGARQLLTLRGPEGPRRGAACLDLGIINDGSVLIRDGRIVSVGQSRRVDNLAEASHALVYEAHGAVVMPGFVDANAALPENASHVRRLLALAFSHGSTTIGGRASYAMLRTLAAAESHGAFLVPALEIESGFDDAQINRAVRRNLAQFLRLDLLAHPRSALHFFHSLGPAIRAYTASPANPDWIGLALAYGASTLDIAAPLDRAQVALLSDSPACIIVTPASASSARGLIDRHAAVALGSGFAANAGATCSMQQAALLAVRDGGLDIAEAITLATINAAHALGVAGVCGSLEAGKRANVLMLHLSDFRDLANYNGVNVVSKIFQAGTLVS
ncbi:MAG: amidohydrolase family protein [Bryobacteraceae bacterium]